MIRLKSELERPPRWRRRLRLLFLVLSLAGAALVAEHLRGEHALKSWKTRMAAQGEVFEARALWPPAQAGNSEFSNQLAQAAASSRKLLGSYAGQLSATLVQEPGKARRGSQEPQPPVPQKIGATNTWKDLDSLLQQNQPSFNALRELMKNPPATMGGDVMGFWENDSFPNFVSIRINAQALHASAVNDLHEGDLPAATQDLAALLSFSRLYENDPALVNYMIRIAIIGLSVDVFWDALQADGWTEPQLATLQKQCADTGRLLSQLPRTMELERAGRLYTLDWFASHTYETWVSRYWHLYGSIGCHPPAADIATPIRLWRQWVFHPAWSFAWEGQEELEYLLQEQQEIVALRAAVEHRSWVRLKDQITAHQRNYRPPPAAWRFYVRLPMVDDFGHALADAKAPAPAYPYPDFSKAFLAAMKNLTLQQMLTTVIAIKRFELSHGKPPPSLVDLTPAFLPALPCDLMDGQPLRYRTNSNGSFTLYSVGEDGRDDGGVVQSEPREKREDTTSPWNGKDWVWPQPAPAAKARQG